MLRNFAFSMIVNCLPLMSSLVSSKCCYNTSSCFSCCLYHCIWFSWKKDFIMYTTASMAPYFSPVWCRSLRGICGSGGVQHSPNICQRQSLQHAEPTFAILYSSKKIMIYSNCDLRMGNTYSCELAHYSLDNEVILHGFTLTGCLQAHLAQCFEYVLSQELPPYLFYQIMLSAGHTESFL